VGGGTVVNGMFFARGAAADYDAWEQLGNPGWGWDGLLLYFKKVSPIFLQCIERRKLKSRAERNVHTTDC